MTSSLSALPVTVGLTRHLHAPGRPCLACSWAISADSSGGMSVTTVATSICVPPSLRPAHASQHALLVVVGRVDAPPGEPRLGRVLLLDGLEQARPVLRRHHRVLRLERGFELGS